VPTDPFEITAQESGGQSVQPSVSPFSSSSPGSMRVGLLFQAAALSVISYQWIAGAIPVAWHALVAVIAVMLPTDSLTSLARGAIKAWANRGK
jgi:hypothetical protein